MSSEGCATVAGSTNRKHGYSKRETTTNLSQTPQNQNKYFLLSLETVGKDSM